MAGEDDRHDPSRRSGGPGTPTRTRGSRPFIVAAVALLLAPVLVLAPSAAASAATASDAEDAVSDLPTEGDGDEADPASRTLRTLERIAEDPDGTVLSLYAWLFATLQDAVPGEDGPDGVDLDPILEELGLVEAADAGPVLDPDADAGLTMVASSGQAPTRSHGVRPGADGTVTSPAATTASLSTPALAFAATLAVGAGLAVVPTMSLYRRVKKSKALNNDVRRAIYRFVENNPGATITEIADGVGCSHSTATYHVQILEELDHITKRRDGNSLHVFPADAGLGRKEALLLSYMRDRETREIIRSVYANPWTYPSELARSLNISRSSAQWHLEKLEDCGIVQVARDGKFSYLYIDPDMKDTVEQHLVR